MGEGVRRVEAARDEVIDAVKKGYRQGKSGDENLSPYSETHHRRRSREGKSTSPKDFRWSGTMLESIKEVSRHVGQDYIEVVIGFDGTPYRRADQKPWHKREPTTTEEQAYLLQRQQRINKVLSLSTNDRERIQRTHNVQIDD